MSMGGIDLWVVLQASALVTAGFGVWILARACWDYAGLPVLQDAYLHAVDDRLQELGEAAPAPAREAVLAAVGRVRRRGISAAQPRPSSSAGARGRDAEYLRRIGRALAARPSRNERAASQDALLRLLGRPALAARPQPAMDAALAEVAGAATAAGTVGDLVRMQQLQRNLVWRLRREVSGRFLAAFLPGMARYLDFVGRGSSLGLALGVLLAGGLAGNVDLVGALTTMCGVGGAVIFTLTVIRCESRSWPAGRPGLWLRVARRYPQAFFLLRLALTTTAVLLGVHLLRT
ncbi:hypothetical protein J2M53_12780 [Arthrobacter sp. zg-ZUI100]|uniref:hypothetical protein n=1 Tax=Arthrobacter jiangjiafuii TaxID=2817475 RepID=UPI001AEF0F11|nr:hypothetical protein [Arthrobacter jiangjiafuii]MBP3037118.1 hypothetical protein [Arthrobacter jiangjiafuii]